jgi:hypothetical protein
MSGSSPWTFRTISQPVRAGRVIGARHDRRAAERVDGIGHALIVGRHEHGIDARRLGGAPEHVLDHRPAGDESQGLPGKASRLISRGDDGDNSGGTNGVSEPSRRNDGHDES